jgi:hypothetical protein
LASAPLQGGSAITPSATTIISLMNPLWLACCRNNDKPDLIISSNDYYTFYWNSMQVNQRYTSADEAETGFQMLKYASADVAFDGGSGIPTSHMYFCNTEYFELVAHEDANMTELEQKMPLQQDAVVIPIIWMGNLVCSNRSLQGVLKA